MKLNITHLLATLGLAALSLNSVAADPEYLRIIGTDTKFVVKNAKGEAIDVAPGSPLKVWIPMEGPAEGALIARMF